MTRTKTVDRLGRETDHVMSLSVLNQLKLLLSLTPTIPISETQPVTIETKTLLIQLMHHHFKRTRIEAILPAADALSDLQTYDSAETAIRYLIQKFSIDPATLEDKSGLSNSG
jgi:hypothetical protein